MEGFHGCNAADAKVYPSVHVIGYPKAGTSFLHTLLMSSPRIKSAVVPFEGEWCPSKVMFNKTEYFARFRAAPGGKAKTICHGARRPRACGSGANSHNTIRTANGCIDTRQSLHVHACVSPYLRFQPKYIISFRPPAEWQWARYNFWTHELDAREGIPGSSWTDSDSFRSPEMFHELVLAGNKTKLFTYASMNLVQGWVDLIEASRRTVGRSNLLVLLSNNLGLPETRASIANFLGIPEDFGLQIDALVNSGANLATRGANQAATVKTGSNVYEISKFRPMKHATRLLIRKRNRVACCAMRYKYSIDLGCCD